MKKVKSSGDAEVVVRRPGKPLYLSWIRFQRRPVSMQACFDFDVHFMPIRWRGKAGLALSYLANFGASLKLLWSQRPDTVWVQVPQYPALWAAMIYRRFSSRRITLVADCHNSIVWKPWNRFPLGPSLLPSCDLVLVHNAEVAVDAAALGVPAEKMLVLEDAPGESTRAASPPADDSPRPWLVFPASWAADEPIAQVLEAARRMPEATFFITGNPTRANPLPPAEQIPRNVKLLGFLPLADFDAYLSHADLVLALTLEEGIQLSVCNEAVGLGLPMVCSGTRILRQIFRQGTVFVDASDPDSIVAGCREALAQREDLALQMQAFRLERRQQWLQGQALPVSQRLQAAGDAVLPGAEDVPAG